MMDENTTATQKGTYRRFTRSSRSSVGTGTISLLMIFTVLCFATLALLSLTTAVSNQRIQKNNFDRTVALSAAEGETAVAIAALDAQLAGLDDVSWTDGNTAVVEFADEEAARLAVVRAVQPLAEEQGWQVDAEEGTLTWTQPIDEENQLVTVLAPQVQGAQARYELLSQKTVYTGEWTPEQPGQVWPGNGASASQAA